LEFDVTLQGWSDGINGVTAAEITRFQNNIQSIFQRVRLLYGATPSEDIINYNVIVRSLTEWTSTNQTGTMDQTSIAEGIGGVTFGKANNAAYGLVNVRDSYIQGINSALNTTVGPANFTQGTGFSNTPNGQSQSGFQGNGGTNLTSFTCTRRYQVTFALGMFNQDKLIPTKFMASQLAIEITLEQVNSCIFSAKNAAVVGAPPVYGVGNVNLIPEILVFDSSYDAMFLKGLQEGGVPIKFSSWHTFIFGTQNSSTMMLQIQERSRSVKALFAVQRRAPPTINSDSGATFFDSSTQDGVNGNSMQNYQYRIGGRYYPASPVQLSTNPGSGVTNGGAEAFLELQKALNIVGDYRLSASCNTMRWALPPQTALPGPIYGNTQLNELDYSQFIQAWGPLGHPTLSTTSIPGVATAGNSFAGNLGSNCFAMAINLETSNGVEISGLNAEEQSDISLQIYWKASQGPTNVIEVYSYYDAMWVLRENNVLELIQ